MNCLAMALRNLRANRRRSLVTMLLCTVTTGILVFSSAWLDGSHGKMVQSAVEVYPGYVQVTHRDFRESPSYDNLILAADSLKKEIEDLPGIERVASRFESFVLFATEQKSVGGMLAAIEPQPESGLSRLQQSLVKGRYLTPDDTNQVYLGSELARRLNLELGATISFIGSGADASFAADNLAVVGIFKTGLFEFDARSAFVNKGYFDTVMASTGLATHLVVLPAQRAQSQEVARTIGREIPEAYRAESWQESMAGLVEAMEVDSIFGYITLAIIFLVIFFVVMIYTLLAVFARVREIGVLRAIGTTPGQVFRLLISESVLLSGVSVLLGGVIGGGLAYYFHQHPIAFSGYEEQFKQYGLIATEMPTAFSPVQIVRDMGVMFLLSVAATLYPIAKVNSYRPIEAMHHV